MYTSILAVHEFDSGKIVRAAFGSHCQTSPMKTVTRLKRSPAMIDAGLPPARHANAGALTLLALAVALAYPVNVAMAATYTVNTAGDPGPAGTVSLRRAVQLANNNAGDTVQFDASLVGSTISLDSGAIGITRSMTIAGPGADRLTISGKNSARVFSITGYGSSITVTISGLTLTQGKAPVNGNGGAIYADSTNLTLQDSVISASTARYGGGVFTANGNATIDGSRIRENYAAADGGGLAAYQDNLFAVTRSTISGNKAAGYGGGMHVEKTSTMYLRYSMISGNTLGYPAPYLQQGGGGLALKNIATVAKIVNSTIVGNYADTRGGGIGIRDAAAGNHTAIYFSTIAGNVTPVGSQSGIYAASGGTPEIVNSIVANNFSHDSNDDLAGRFSLFNCLIKTPGAAVITGFGGNVFGQDPQLGPLLDNGGPTLTMLPSFDSPAIDAAVNGFSFASDQRGLSRAAPAGHPDMGAVERQYPEDFIFRDGFGSP